MHRPRTLHLFAGAGGGILADLLLGHQPVCAVEIDQYCQQVLVQRQKDGHLPWFPIFPDVCTFDGRHRVDQLARQVYASLDGSRLFTAPTVTMTDTALSVETILRIAHVPDQLWKSANTPSSMMNSMPAPRS